MKLFLCTAESTKMAAVGSSVVNMSASTPFTPSLNSEKLLRKRTESIVSNRSKCLAGIIHYLVLLLHRDSLFLPAKTNMSSDNMADN